MLAGWCHAMDKGHYSQVGPSTLLSAPHRKVFCIFLVMDRSHDGFLITQSHHLFSIFRAKLVRGQEQGYRHMIARGLYMAGIPLILGVSSQYIFAMVTLSL